MSTVLVVVGESEMEALMGDLVLFAGFSPTFVRDDETAAGAVERRHPNVLLMDAALETGSRVKCETEARRAGTVIVYFASTMSSGELRGFAEERGAGFFALPNGPKLLGPVLRRRCGAETSRPMSRCQRCRRRLPPSSSRRFATSSWPGSSFPTPNRS